MAEQLHNVNHDYIRYANCWEDADVLLEALEVKPGDRVLSIGSAGDNSFSLLINNPELVVAVDINSAQLKLIELKKAAILALDYEHFLQFLGFKECSNRQLLFEKVKNELSNEANDFWNANYELIRNGIIHQGKFEKYFQLFHKKILPLIHSKRTIDNLFAAKDVAEQQKFYERKWNNIRWRVLFKVFFSKFIMGKFGRDPEFLKEVRLSVSKYILDKSAKHLCSIDCQENYFLHYILKGTFGSKLPHYAREENFDKIKQRVNKLQIVSGLAEDAFAHYSELNKFNLSNIFEYMNSELFLSVVKVFEENSRSNSRFVYWNLMVPRSMSKCSVLLEFEDNISTSLTEKDKCFFYSHVLIDTKR